VEGNGEEKMKKNTIKELKKVHKSMNKPLGFKKKLTSYHLVAFIMLVVILTTIPMYFLGKSEGYNQKTSEITKIENQETQKELMEKSVGEVWDIFLKYLMVKTMIWLPLILIAICVGWILHGVF
jgi:hypothetical protein